MALRDPSSPGALCALPGLSAGNTCRLRAAVSSMSPPVPHLGLSEGKTCLLGAAVSSMSQLSPRSVRGADCDVFGVVWMFFLHCFLSPEAAQSGSPCSKAQIALVTAVNFPGFSPELENSNENNNAEFFFCFMC